MVSPGVASASRDPRLDLSGSSSLHKGSLSLQPQIARDTTATPVDTADTALSRMTPSDTADASGTFKLVPSSTETKVKKATRCPSSVDPRAPAFCRMWGLAEPTPGSEVARFLDHWCTKNGERGLSADWAATWRARPEWTRSSNARVRGGPQRSESGWDENEETDLGRKAGT
jgi:hypothetical protein